MPGCVIVVVKMEGASYLCKTDEVGEICVNSGATGTQYWGLPGLSNTTFKVNHTFSVFRQVYVVFLSRCNRLAAMGNPFQTLSLLGVVY